MDNGLKELQRACEADLDAEVSLLERIHGELNRKAQTETMSEAVALLKIIISTTIEQRRRNREEQAEQAKQQQAAGVAMSLGKRQEAESLKTALEEIAAERIVDAIFRRLPA